MSTITKVSLDRAEALAKALGYTGQKSAKDIKAFFDGYNENVEDTSGNPVDLKAIEIEAPAPKRVAFGGEPEAKAAAPDIEALVTAELDKRAKAMGLKDKADREAGTKRVPVLSIEGGMTVEQKAYQRRIDSKQAVFKSIDDASLVSDWLFGCELAQKFPMLCASPTFTTARKRWDARVQVGNFGAETKDLTMAPGSGAILAGSTFSSEIIRLFDDYGLIPTIADVKDNVVGSTTFPKVDPTSIVGRYPASSPSGSSTQSQDLVWSNVTVSPKQCLIFGIVNNELLKKSPLAILDEVTSTLAWAAAKEADRVGISGDGTTTYGGIYGLKGGFTAQDSYALSTSSMAVNTDVAGSNAAGTWGAYTIGHFHNMKSKVRRYARQRYGGKLQWLFSQELYDAVVVPIAVSASRATATEVFSLPNGVPMLLGHEVLISEELNNSAANTGTLIDGYFGNFRAGLMYARGAGGFEIMSSEHAKFFENGIALRASFQHDVNFHDRGANTASGTRGSVAVLYQT
jgi:HK97 family phage major capsid protein